MGIMLVVAIAMIFIVALLAVSRFLLTSSYVWYRRYRLMKNKLFYNSFLRYILQSNLKLGVTAGTSLTLLAANTS